jgi:hypothetical protein
MSPLKTRYELSKRTFQWRVDCYGPINKGGEEVARTKVNFDHSRQLQNAVVIGQCEGGKTFPQPCEYVITESLK